MQEASNKLEVPNHPKEITIIVNARPKPWLDKDISFQQVVVLAFGTFPQDPSTAYTITYKGGESKKEGSMISDDVIKVKDKMIFNVTATSKS